MVWKRDRVCVLCARTGFEVDHIVPVVLGGGLCSLNGCGCCVSIITGKKPRGWRKYRKQKRRCR